MIFLKSQDCVFKWRFCDMWQPDVQFCEGGQVTPPPIPAPPPHPPTPPSFPVSPPPPRVVCVEAPPVHHTQPVLQGCQAEIPAKKLKRGHRKKNFWPNFGWFYQKQAEKGPQKIFKRCSLFLAVITVINLIFNIQYTNFLRPLFCLFLVKISQNSARNFFLWPLLSFLAGISA